MNELKYLELNDQGKIMCIVSMCKAKDLKKK